MKVSIGPWAARKYFLDKMSLGDLIKAYFTYYAVLVYLSFGVAAIWLTLKWREETAPLLAAVAVVILIYPLIWYLLHRFVLHGSYLYKIPATARIWKRIHFDHHQDPNDLGVLFGALYTTLPTVFLVTGPVGWAIGGTAGASAAIATGLLVTCVYEFCHCIQHLPFVPRYKWLRRIKKLHLAHHFHNEQGNYGITSFTCDRLLGTYYKHPKLIARSSTVFNLGYTDEVAMLYPWVARLSDPPARPPRRPEAYTA